MKLFNCGPEQRSRTRLCHDVFSVDFISINRHQMTLGENYGSNYSCSLPVPPPAFLVKVLNAAGRVPLGNGGLSVTWTIGPWDTFPPLLFHSNDFSIFPRTIWNLKSSIIGPIFSRLAAAVLISEG